MCYTCLKAKNVCKGRKCDFVASTPEILKCVICATWAESKGLAPFSIFFCRSKSHTSSRAPLSKLKAELEKYIGKLGTTVVDTKIRFSVNYFKKTQRFRARRSRANNPRSVDEAPTFNSQTGDQVPVQPESVDSEISENSSYILQNIKLGKSECLIFFDTGANSHLIDGNLALKEGLQAISSERTKLAMIAGGQVESEFGKFRFNLGPGGNEKYHEITVVGTNEITPEFHKYDIEEINLEYLKDANDDEKENILPKTVGGSKVHLLLGLKNTKIQPVLIKVLASGVGVYLSHFKDVDGSRIIYAGLSKCFTQTDDDMNRESNHAVYTVS